MGHFGSADDHRIGYEEEEDGSYSVDEFDEDSDDNVSVEDPDIDDSGDEDESAPESEVETVNRAREMYIYTAAEKMGYTHLIPPYSNSIPCIGPFRKAMPGLFSFSLPMLFYLIDPKSRLAFDAHDSEEDTMMLFIVLVIFALKISGKEDDFLSWWERDQDLPGGWTAGFIADWMKKPIKARPGVSPLNLPAVSSRKRRLESAGSSKPSKKAKTQSNNSKSQPKKAETQPRKRKTPTKKGASGRKVRKSPPNSLTNQKKQGHIVVQDPSPDQQEASRPTARQSSRTKGKLPKYRKKSDRDDSDGSVYVGMRLTMRARYLKSSLHMETTPGKKPTNIGEIHGAWGCI